MIVDDLETIVKDQKMLEKALKQPGFQTATNEIAELIKDKFNIGKTSYIHEFLTPNGSKLKFKFYKVLKPMLNSKGLAIAGKESWLSYLSVTSEPSGQRGFTFTTLVKREVWAYSKSTADAAHRANCLELFELGKNYGINLSDESSWCTVYSDYY